jgi:phosphinothricin acetyltransferase
MIRDVSNEDAPRIAEIYNPYILKTIITFEEVPVTGDEMLRRIGNITGNGFPWIVLETEDGVTGYAYAGAWRTRPAYRHTVETTIYLDQEFKGKGYGKNLYAALLERLKRNGVHTAIGGISLPNVESVKLHESLGFIKVAHFASVGFKFDKWIDVGFWQLML